MRLYRQGLGFEVKHIWGHEQKVYMLDAGGGACVELFEGYTGELDAPGAPCPLPDCVIPACQIVNLLTDDFVYRPDD